MRSCLRLDLSLNRPSMLDVSLLAAFCGLFWVGIAYLLSPAAGLFVAAASYALASIVLCMLKISR